MFDEDPRVTRAVERWGLTLGEPYPDVYPGNFVCRCSLADGTRAVIKTEPERGDGDEFLSGIEALLLYGGRGMVRVLELVRAERVVLMEIVEPGATTWREPIDRALEAVASVTRMLRKAPPPDGGFPDVRSYLRAWPNHGRLYGGPGPIDVDLFETGERLFVELCDTSAAPVVLHGDLHFGNVLRSERESWLAIDPKGVIGEPCYEVGDVFRNRVDELYQGSDPIRAMRRRVEALANLTGFDCERIRLWALAQAVLSEIWTADDPDSDRAAGVDLRAARLLTQIGPIG
jgi:streptomycin 6-kinase